MDPILLHEFQKNSKEIVRVEISEYRGKKLLNIRTWFLNDEGQYLPSKKGIAVSVEKIPELIDALKKAKEYLEES
ncbi:MAG: transcriptional regulator [Candidatus Hydrogenedentota bacterium]|nr:MAG: transcriptional regulator [Candidatus Hydrogenedentota bacterium]